MEKMDTQEMISALADGQLHGDALVRGLEAAATDEGRATWSAYCAIGEVLRTGRVAPPVATSHAAFLARLQASLQQEAARRPALPVAVAPIRTVQPAANDWRWKLAAGVASVAAVASVGWNVWGTAGGNAGLPQLAAAPASVIPVAADPRATVMIRDPRLDQLLQAHRQLGSATALQSPSGFLRNATFEGPAR